MSSQNCNETRNAPDHILKLEGVGKSFWSIPVLSNINLAVRRGEVHALVGENGAGKSTLIKIICGAYTKDTGRIILDGKNYNVSDPQEGLARGVAAIYQETSLVPTMTVIENVFLHIEPVSGVFSLCDKRTARNRFDKLCQWLGYDLRPDAKVADIGPAERKLTEIAKALAHNAKLLIMDEPTDCLTRGEIDNFFRIVDDLKSRGITILYITHYLNELFRIADLVTILKDGGLVKTMHVANSSSEEIIRLMLGSKNTAMATPEISGEYSHGETVLEARSLSAGNSVSDVTFSLHKGEVVGLVGVIGSGKTELARLLFGADHADAGEVWIGGKTLPRLNPRLAKRLGIGFLPEDRKNLGLIQEQSVSRNLTLGALKTICRRHILSTTLEKKICGGLLQSLSIKTSGLEQRVKFLSGGNQQKVVIGKWLLAAPDILILDEPTRGIDVGAKSAIYDLVREMRDAGKAILFISSELPEVLTVSDRILVMRKGCIVGEFSRGASQEKVLGMMLEAE